MSEENLLAFQGQIVPQSFSAGFVALSYFISLIGATSTLELINRRTGAQGLFNNVLLGSAAATMGGVSIWSMHFIGNRAIHMGDGEAALQIAFSSGFTALSFFVPIIVLWGAFLAIGTNDAVSWWRIGTGGLLCGTAVCGMHYLGNASIQNYVCIYKIGNVAGSAIIAVVASTIALATFFAFRAMWANAWWKRLFSGGVMAGAVSGMHWCAAVGTEYRLVTIHSGVDQPPREATVIVVIFLSAGACIIMAGIATIKARNMSKSARRAQQITLGAAIFDKHDRILVDPDGLIPSTIITDSFLETNEKEGFGIGHPLYQWMFQASRNWNAISSLAGGIRKHAARVPDADESGIGRTGKKFMSTNGNLTEEYGVIFRELFCVAAMTLAERLREDLTSAGILWDEILPTGATGRRIEEQLLDQEGKPVRRLDNEQDLEKQGAWERHQQYGRGALMFLVRRVKDDRDADRLAAAGYRFAETHQVSSIIVSSMQIQCPRVETKFREMAAYIDQNNEPEDGVHIGFFGIRARVNGAGFDVLVRRDAKNLLPAIHLQSKQLEPWQGDILGRFDGRNAATMLHMLQNMTTGPERDKGFAERLVQSIQALRAIVKDGVMEEAIFTAAAVLLPNRGEVMRVTKSLFVFRFVVPIHSVVDSPSCEFIPLSFFKTRQTSQTHQLAFIQGVHREFGRAAHDTKQRTDRLVERRRLFLRGKIGFGKPRSDATCCATQETKRIWEVDAENGSSIVGSTGSGSTVSLFRPWPSHPKSPPPSSGMKDVTPCAAEAPMPISTSRPPSYGGIMVSQEITVDVDEEYGGVTDIGTTRLSPQERSLDDGSLMVLKSTISVEKTEPSEDGIEMKYLGSEGAAATGPKIEGQEARHDYHIPATYVDVLLKRCVDSRQGKM